MVERLPGLRAMCVVLWAVLLFGLGLGLGASLWPRHAKVDEKAALSILQSENMAFLVTRRARTQIVIEHSETDWAGEWRGVLWATVSWRWGVDMKKLAATDIRRDGQTTVVRLPEPELLDFALEPGSVGFMSKSTAVPKLLDFARGGSQRKQLEGRLKEHALQFAQDQQLLPTRQEIVAQLNEASGLLEQSAGTRLRFE